MAQHNAAQHISNKDLLAGERDPLTDRRPEDDPELALVGHRQKLCANLRHQGDRGGEHRKNGNDKHSAMGDHPAQRIFESAVQGLITRSAPLHRANEPSRHGPVCFLFRFEKFKTQRRGHRPRHKK